MMVMCLIYDALTLNGVPAVEKRLDVQFAATISWGCCKMEDGVSGYMEPMLAA
jgi:hypothetical protein